MEFKIDGKILGLSESSDGTKLIGKILICPLDEPNLNKKGIKEFDLTEAELKSLIGQPLVGKVVKNSDDSYDFTGHNLKKIYEYNSETNAIEIKYIFDTVPIGYFTSSEIEEVKINGVIKRCIVANVEIWKRYTKACEVIIKRYESEKQLSVSWEIDYQSKYDEDGTTWLKDLVFIGVAVLGEKINGAYPNARFMEISELELTTSLTEDIIQEIQKELIVASTDVDINNINENIESQGGKKMSKINNEMASLTDNDLYTKVRQAINLANPNDWHYISYLFPYEYRAIAHKWEDSDTDFTEFKYSVNSDDSVSITSQTPIKMQFVAVETIAEKDTQITELSTKLSEKETEISTKLDEIIKLGEEIKSKEIIISEKETVIAELQPLKKQFEAAELAKKEAELSQKKADLKAYATKGNYISTEEIETSEEIKNAIENLDMNYIKGVIADRVVASLDVKEVEVSSTENKVEITTNLNASTSVTKEPLDIFKEFLN